MNNRVLVGLGVGVIVIGAVFVLFGMNKIGWGVSPSSQTVSELAPPFTLRITDLDGRTNTLDFDTDTYDFIEIARTPSKILLCPSTHYGDTDGCRILIVDLATKNAIELGFPDYAPRESIPFSPDKEHLLLATESGVMVIDADTLAYREIFRLEEGTVPGTYGCLPTFKSEAKWLNNTQVQIPIYINDGTCDKEPPPQPKDVRTISI